jgi:hypothetical protein
MLGAMAAQTSRDEAAARASASPPALARADVAASNAPPLLFASARPSTSRFSVFRHGRTLLPFAGAAAIAIAWGFAGRQPMALTEGAARVGAGFSNDELVNQFVDVHSHPMHPETPDPKEVRAFEREVGVPVHVPQLEKNARFVGGRLLPVQGGERAAMLQYEVAQANGGVQRVSVFVYDPRRVHIRSAEQLAPRAVGTAEVRVGQARGYSVAVSQHGSIGYAVTSDLDEDASAQYALAADRE